VNEPSDRSALLARSWDEAAAGYEAYFVPRFAPWVSTAVAASAAAPLPDGPVLVPCCGTFPELAPLAEQYDGREIVGIDLSAGMLRLARNRAELLGQQVSLVEGDAVALDHLWTGACAAVLSVFGLQQLPDTAAALRSWAATLRPGGRLAVMFWPETPEADRSPWPSRQRASQPVTTPGNASCSPP
jgi:ubiquinone/menaquinone biosynthesis C-methylase UbiE